MTVYCYNDSTVSNTNKQHTPVLCCSTSLCLMRCLMRPVPMKTSTSEQPGPLSVLFFKGNDQDVASKSVLTMTATVKTQLVY